MVHFIVVYPLLYFQTCNYLERWQPPTYHVPDLDFQRTLVAGYPSGDKRLVFIQMEALTGLPAKDEWDFKYLGITSEPFIKANYPHHEGTWGWRQQANQVMLVVRNLRRSLVEYHDILWDIGYAKTWEVASMNLNNLYQVRPPKEDFLHWRDLRILDEVHWYGWFIDYYMEGGLMRDMFSHRITTEQHWNMLIQPTRYEKEEMTYELIVGNTVVTPTYDPHCINDVSGGCEPVAIISGERLIDPDTGPAENRKIAQVIMGSQVISDFMIPEDAWECIWTELIINKKGLKTFVDREGIAERDYNFSEEMLADMLEELDRLIIKYSNPDWKAKLTVKYLVELLSEHRGQINQELIEVQTGVRKLEDHDFLGPKTRKKRALEKTEKKLYWGD